MDGNNLDVRKADVVHCEGTDKLAFTNTGIRMFQYMLA
ncbi:MAG: hypothetical protein K0Q87_4372 [Neobacillus sp.]|jgi:hypothetical protein|nr:hypothetical protein [Neobacillus sp.]